MIVDAILNFIYEKLLLNASAYVALAIILLIFVVAYMLMNPEKAFLWSAAITRLFSKISKRASKSTIESEINGRILFGVRNISKEMKDILPYTVRFNWQEKTDRQSFFDSQQVVLCMDPTKTKNQNIIHALVDYVGCGLVPKKIESILDDDLSKAQKMVLTHKIIMTSYKEGLRYYIDNYFDIEQSDALKSKIISLQRLDRDGLFTQVALKELCMYISKQDISLIDISFGNEYSNFIGFLENLACRNKGDDTPLSFTGRFFKVGIILTAKDTTYGNGGNEAYLRRFRAYCHEGITSIYIRSRGNRKNEITKALLSELKKEFDLSGKYKVYEYNCADALVDKQKALCIYFDVENGLL